MALAVSLAHLAYQLSLVGSVAAGYTKQPLLGIGQDDSITKLSLFLGFPKGNKSASLESASVPGGFATVAVESTDGDAPHNSRSGALRGGVSDSTLRPAQVQGPHASINSRMVRVPLQFSKNSYYCQASLGDDGQEMSLLIDTGSGNLIVPSTGCNSPSCKRHHRFDASSSGVRRIDTDRGGKTKIHFGSGDVSVEAFEGRICLGETACDDKGKIVLADSESDDFSKFDFDGLLGLGLPPLALDNTFNLVGALTSKGVLSAPTFALSLRARGEPSELLLGGWDTSHIAPGKSLLWVEVEPTSDGVQTLWQIDLQKLEVGSNTVDCDSCKASLDSGTGTIALPPAVLTAVKSQIGDLDCARIDSLPVLEFRLGGNDFELEPQDYVEISRKDSSHCRLSITSYEDEFQQTVLLGQPFMRRYYTVFDQTGPRIGLAAAAQ